MSVVTEVAVAVALGWFFGNMAEEKWPTLKPWPTLLGITLFFSLSLTHAIKLLQRIQERLEKEDVDGSADRDSGRLH